MNQTETAIALLTEIIILKRERIFNSNLVPKLEARFERLPFAAQEKARWKLTDEKTGRWLV